MTAQSTDNRQNNPMSHCGCRVCSTHRRWVNDLDMQSAKALSVYEEMAGAIEAAETAAAYWQMKFENSWPEQKV